VGWTSTRPSALRCRNAVANAFSTSGILISTRPVKLWDFGLMGTLRFLLATSVAYGHAGAFLGFPLIPGDTAVQSFYAISGFYIALVLNEKYRPESPSYFLFIS